MGQAKSSRKQEDVRSVIERDRENETPQALLNDIVLQNIFRYLAYRDLKSCRKVGNRTWLRNSKKAWYSRTKVVFRGDKKVTKKVEDYPHQTEITSNVTNYKIESREVDLYHICDSLGHTIKELEFENCGFLTADAFFNLIYTKCPNLEKFSAELIDFDAGTNLKGSIESMVTQFGTQTNLKFLKLRQVRGLQSPELWSALLSRFPNLQALETRTDKVDIFEVISSIRQHDTKILKLNHIDIWVHSKSPAEQNNSLCSVLLDPDLSFETIAFYLWNCNPETLADILNFHAESLRKFTIIGDAEFREVKILLQRPLNNLDELKINCSITGNIFNFTPNVRKVELGEHAVSNLARNTGTDLKLESCKELRLPFKLYNLELEFVLNAFPNVEILYICGLSNQRFSMICEQWIKLVSFAAEYNEVDSLGILGYDPKVTDDIRKPNITNLKDLQSFSSSPLKVNGKWSRESKYLTRLNTMKHARLILKELEGLHCLQKFELKDYKLKGNKKTWKKIFAKYSDH